jgi:hypothetical protein
MVRPRTVRRWSKSLRTGYGPLAMTRRFLPCLTALLVVSAACERERRAPTGPAFLPPERAVVRFERAAGPSGPDEVLTISGLGYVTWREVRSGAVARTRMPVEELLALERAFDDAGFGELPPTVGGPECASCPSFVLTHGLEAGEQSVVLTGHPRGHPAEVRTLVERLSVVAARAQAARRASTGSGGSAGDRLENGLEIALAVGSSAVRPGEPLYLQLRISNSTDRPIRLTFPSTQNADFRIESIDGQVLWSLGESRAALRIAHDVVLAPGESQTFEEVWLGRTTEGKRAEPGSYLAVGEIRARDGGVTPPVAFQIR